MSKLRYFTDYLHSLWRQIAMYRPRSFHDDNLLIIEWHPMVPILLGSIRHALIIAPSALSQRSLFPWCVGASSSDVISKMTLRGKPP